MDLIIRLGCVSDRQVLLHVIRMMYKSLYATSICNDLGFKTDKWEIYPGDPNVVGILPGKSSDIYHSLIINGHVDVAEVGDDNEWDIFPFYSFYQGFLYIMDVGLQI